MEPALLVIDIQNDYFAGGTNPLVEADMAATNAARMIEFFRDRDLPVIFIQHIAKRSDAKAFIPGTGGAGIADQVRPLPGEKIFQKHFPNSFRETSLHEYLQAIGVKQLVVCGMMTHMCVDATVRAAKDFGYECLVIGDACATCDLDYWNHNIPAELANASFLAAFTYYYAGVVRTSEYIAKHS
jgi:nicotinamidase-related amidase